MIRYQIEQETMKPGEVCKVQAASKPAGLYEILEKSGFAEEQAARVFSGLPWTEVDPAGRAFACGWLLCCSAQPLCFVCPEARSQESLAGELDSWIPGGAMFPEMAAVVTGDSLPDPEEMAARLELIHRLGEPKPPAWLVITESQMEEEVPAPDSLREDSMTLRSGFSKEPGPLAEVLEKWGYERQPQVFARGQFAMRGGILDVFSWQQQFPVRVEFFDTEIESLREFDLDRQTSLRKIEKCEILRAFAGKSKLVPLRNILKGFQLVRVEPVDPNEPDAGVSIGSALDPDAPSLLPISACEEAAFSAGDFVMDAARRERFFAQLREWKSEGWKVALFCDNEGERERFCELCREHGGDPSAIIPLEGDQGRGFICTPAKLAVLTDSDLFGRSISRRIKRLARRREGLFANRAAGDPTEFEEGDFVVHLEHGIGRFLGMQRMDGSEVLALEFAADSRLYVPVEQAWQVSRYIGLGKRHPSLSDLGSKKWDQAKSRAQRAVFEYAQQMLSLQAIRETAGGFSFPPDGVWQQEFDDAFVFEETPDQARAIEAAKRDMESPLPMDRLICGDVGFGKTEVAIRAAFKAVMGGKQVAFLAPTTVLAQQHFHTLRERMSDYPIRIEMLSRFRTHAEQTRTVAGLASGEVDIAVGTHRLISPDVLWKDLGLLIVDEEQRFGVHHKELLKERFRLVDVLTLSATPIPRTLYLALMGARDMSVIETPPPNRQPVETVVCGYDERILRDAIQRELTRGGQVYVLHNRVRTIEKLASRVRELVPQARVAIGHGQMGEKELEEVMGKFVEGKVDVLVSTTIIESGLDIPNANTILIDRADLFGLADLYQLRGRVGRSGVKAYAYLMLPRSLLSVGAARKRISAIKQYSRLGAGFQIAMRDLEIRGAGNILGTAQSGHIITVGFDLYCKLLRTAVDKLKGHSSGITRHCPVRLDFVAGSEGEDLSPAWMIPAYLPTSYLQEAKLRIESYRRLNEAGSVDALEALKNEWKDRFGPLPLAVENLILRSRVSLEAASRKIGMVEVRDDRLMLTRRGDYLLVGGKFPRLQSVDPNSRLREVLDAVRSLVL